MHEQRNGFGRLGSALISAQHLCLLTPIAGEGQAHTGQQTRENCKMKWSWKITRLAGIDIYVHATFLVLVLWIALGYWQLQGTIAAVINGVGFILALFACVVLHELGHALMARRYNIRTRHITLLPIGGIAALEKMPDQPLQEIAVAVAGPLVNLGIAFVLWALISFSSGLDFTSSSQLTDNAASWTEGPFLQRLMIVNIILAVFNMLPALPMDGGRVFRALLALRMNHQQATEKAAKFGQTIALVLGFAGLLYNPFLVFIALFVWIGAAAELHSEKTKTALQGVTVGDAMLTDYATLSSQHSLAHAVELTLAGSQEDFPVVEAQQVCGVLTQSDLLRGLRDQGNLAIVQDWMQRDLIMVESTEPLDSVLQRLQGTACKLLCVTKNGHQVGIINIANFMEFIAIQKALSTSTLSQPISAES